MLTFFLFILFLVVFLILMLGTSVLRILRAIFFGGSYASGSNRQGNDTFDNSASSRRTSSSRTYVEEDERTPRKKKVFADNEGEYVDYEEIR